MPQKTSHRKTKLPALSGTSLTRVVFPGTMSARVLKSGRLNPMKTSLTFFASFRGGEGRPWLLAIVRNTYFDWRRKTHRMYAEEPFDEELPDHSGSHPMHEPRSGDPLSLLMKKSEGEAVTQALLRIEEAYREVLVLRELEELSYKEIATVVGAPTGTVMSRLARARKRLREELDRSVAAA
jgi:RNA polymerase sigma factor (sigma-70 family)